VVTVPIETIEKPTERLLPPVAASGEDEELLVARRRQARRVRRLRVHVAAWSFGAIVATAAWIAVEWQSNGMFERFAHEGNDGDWNPTLWALVVLVWGLVVGTMALRVRFERPPTEAEVGREAARLSPDRVGSDAGVRRLARRRLARVGLLRFRIAAWLLAMVVLAPLNVLIEWQDNGGFERLSRDSQPGSWDPWLLYVGGIWGLVVLVVYALPVYVERHRGA
jgi:hypothetical protein